jgi:hypothetical protein
MLHVPRTRYCHRWADTEPERMTFVFGNNSCRLAPLNAERFWLALKNQSLLLIGDSLIGQLFQNLACTLESTSTAVDSKSVVHAPLQSSVEYLWSPFVFECTDCGLDRTHSSPQAEIQFGRVSAALDMRLRQPNGTVLFGFGSWFSVYRLTQLKLLDKQTMSGEQLEEASVAWFRRAVEALFDDLLPRAAARIVVMAVPPGHVGCHKSDGYQAFVNARHRLFGWHLHDTFNTILKIYCKANDIAFLDVYTPSMTRHDGHPGAQTFSNLQQAADHDLVDCLHWYLLVETFFW